MGIVQQNARRLLTLINDLLTLSGVESGKMVLRRELTDLRGVVERCVRDQLQVAEASDLKLSLVLPADPVEAQVDADRIAQVVTNLLANAIKFTGAGGRVGVAVGRSRNGVALSVSTPASASARTTRRACSSASSAPATRPTTRSPARASAWPSARASSTPTAAP